MAQFREFKLSSTVLKGLEALKFEQPTPIQQQAIPIALAGKDVIGLAQTGTGKTAAFCIPLLEKFTQDEKSRGLILAPTRELALQIEQFWGELTQKVGRLRAACLIGGASMRAQLRQLSYQPRLIIATPGRLIDHIENYKLNLSGFSMLVLDEADRMLDMGFEPQLTQIRKRLSGERQTFLFTATWDKRTESVSATYLKSPVRVSVGEISNAAPLIEQELIRVEHKQKNNFLLDELNRQTVPVLIFARTQVRTERLSGFLESYGFPVARIHGGRSQGQRNSALREFREGRARILVATDVASRGIDVPEIGFVINYDLPEVPEDYIHRIGRTGRAGRNGKALALVSREEAGLWNQILRHLKRTGAKLPHERAAAIASTPPVSEVVPARPPRSRRDAAPFQSRRDHDRHRDGQPGDGRRAASRGSNDRRGGFRGPSSSYEGRRPQGEGQGRPERRDGRDQRERFDQNRSFDRYASRDKQEQFKSNGRFDKLKQFGRPERRASDSSGGPVGAAPDTRRKSYQKSGPGVGRPRKPSWRPFARKSDRG